MCVPFLPWKLWSLHTTTKIAVVPEDARNKHV